MRYDPSKEALFSPERQPPLARTQPWPPDALYAELSRLAYIRFEQGETEAARIRQAVTNLGFSGVRLFEDPRETPERLRMDTQGFGVLTRDGRAVIAFRGTQPDSFRDLICDARFLPAGWRGPGQVHRGFLASLESVLPQIEDWLRETRPDGLTVTGHSLGAAVATLLAGLQPGSELVTFGSPRVGDATFAASFAGRPMRRYVDCTDAVTLVPPAPYFVHLDGLRYIDRSGMIHQGDIGFLSLVKDQAAAMAKYVPLSWRPGNVGLRNLADHAPINYISALLGEREGL